MPASIRRRRTLNDNGLSAEFGEVVPFRRTVAEFEVEFVRALSGFAFQEHGIRRDPILLGIVADDDFAFYRYRGHVV